jgi:hypothetical protein
VEEISYRKVVSVQNEISLIVAVGSTREVTIFLLPAETIHDPMNVWLASPLLEGLELANSPTVNQPLLLGESGLDLTLLVDTNTIKDQNGSSLVEEVLHLHGNFLSDQPSNVATFRIDIAVQIQLVTVVVTPASFSYQIIAGSRYFGLNRLSPNFQIEILNPTCSSALGYHVHLARCPDSTILGGQIEQVPPEETFP